MKKIALWYVVNLETAEKSHFDRKKKKKRGKYHQFKLIEFQISC